MVKQLNHLDLLVFRCCRLLIIFLLQVFSNGAAEF